MPDPELPPQALGVGHWTGEIIQAVLKEHGAPVDLVQWIRQRGSRRKTMMFMKHPGVAFSWPPADRAWSKPLIARAPRPSALGRQCTGLGLRRRRPGSRGADHCEQQGF